MGEIRMGGKTLGQLAFEAYCEGVGGLTFDGKPIPGWDDLHGDRLKVQGGWEAAAAEVARLVRMSDLADREFDAMASGDFRERQQTRWHPAHVSRVQEMPEIPVDYAVPVDEAGVIRSKDIEIVAIPDEGPDAA